MVCFPAGKRHRRLDAILMIKRVFGFLAGVAISVLATSTFDADAAGSLVQRSSLGTLIVVGVGLVGFGMWGKGMIFRGKPKGLKDIFGRFNK